MKGHFSNFHRIFLSVFLLAQIGGFHGEPVNGVRRAVEILSGQKSVALIPAPEGIAIIWSDTVDAH
ncbi:hypothetical protein [Jiella marina]|uniref:hypothetical protein n=1 Tax=Jiella sp. LLJ827 TaxID=2917712 RepID=UPI0021015D2F|nr:hypothetical protein [Jiella sp. LLJ827]MCQ0986609.1 hypothetical protein [Jiella sp. LLJ827]